MALSHPAAPTRGLRPPSARDGALCFVKSWTLLSDKSRSASGTLCVVLTTLLPVRGVNSPVQSVRRAARSTSLPAVGVAVARNTPPCRRCENREECGEARL